MNPYMVFLSGPITGRDGWRAEFNAAQERVRERYGNCEVWNPADLSEGHDYAFYMRLCIAELFDADLVVLLPGWEKSPGARAEKALADALRIPCVEIDEAERKGYPRADTITCPACGETQAAQVSFEAWMPFPSYVHTCGCGHIITESEWDSVGNKTEAPV